MRPSFTPEPLGAGPAAPARPAPRPATGPATGPAARGFDAALARATGEGAPPPARPARPLSGLGAAPPPPSPSRPWEGAPNAEFRHRIAQAERSAEHPMHGYGQRNPASGALGRYQFLPSTLFDLGWQDRHGNWSGLAARHGVASEEDFLANPAAQEAAMGAFLRRVEAQLERNGAMAQRGATVRGVDGAEIALTEGGLVAAAHRRGSGMVARWLAHRTGSPEAPLSPRERLAFQQVERRLVEFAQVAYAPAAARLEAPRNIAHTPPAPAAPA